MKLFLSDIKSIIRVPVLLCALLSPVFILLFLLLVFPLIETMKENPEDYNSFYSVTAIALISAIPFIYGLLFSFIHLFAQGQRSSGPDGKRNGLMIRRSAVTGILSLIMILPVIYLTDPVSTEGWLRSLYATILLSVTAPFIFLLHVAFGSDKNRWTILSMISLLFLLAVPSGMVLHHPWNYLAFFSPFYWIGWAWIITPPLEGFLYGVISFGLVAAGSVIFYRSVKV